MEIFVIDSNFTIRMLGKYPDNPIPKTGERINLGYTPCVNVKDITYDYKNKQVYVLIDGFIVE